MPDPITRVFSDIHYGDRMSQLRSFDQLRPLCQGVEHVVLNGDTIDTRPGGSPPLTRQWRADASAFLQDAGVPFTLLTGNHDPDLSEQHSLELAGGRVFLFHGDVLFKDIVPWGCDSAMIGRRIREELQSLPPAARDRFEDRLAVYRRVAAGVRQRHQSEKNPWRYAFRLASDTIWPPFSAFRILQAWLVLPRRAAALARRHRPKARYVLTGHTHRPGVWRVRGGITVINTGSFCAPFGGYLVDLAAAEITVRRISARAGQFHPGRILARLPLAE